MHASKYWLDISTSLTLLLLNIVKAKLRQIPGRDMALEQWFTTVNQEIYSFLVTTSVHQHFWGVMKLEIVLNQLKEKLFL